MERLESHNWIGKLPMLLAVMGALGLLLTLGAGCGEDDPCASKTCNFGVCQSSSGDCVNQDTCRVDAECVPGYLCGDDNTCVAQDTCETNDDCSAGICEDGACVNRDQCESNSECLARTYCADSGTCEPDPCNNVTCNRGVCERGTDNCVPADSCTERTENLDCLINQRCLNEECVSQENYCDQLTCDRGVCSFEEAGCVNASDCEGDRANCQEGFFCNGMDRCQADICVRGGVQCEDDGICDPATGECINPDTCQDNSECTSGFLCVNDQCLPEGSACGNNSGDGGCPGNQVCQYDESNNTASCTEPDVCETSIDCISDRVCGGQKCLSAISCKDDVFEPNNMMGEATDVFSVAPDGFVQASLCQGDTDMYAVTTTDEVEPTFSGQIVATVTIPRRDIGLGEATMTMNDPDGNEIATTSLGAMGQDRQMSLTTTLGVPDHGTYSLEISPGENLTQNGLDYDLSVRIEKENATAACTDAQAITPGQRVSGDTEESAGAGLGSSCTSVTNNSNDAVYALGVERSQEVTIEATPTRDDADINVSIRSRCPEIATERECVDENGGGSAETLTTVLSKGTHYIVIQGPAEGTLGPFSLLVTREFFTACGPDDDYCADGSTASVCQRGGGQFGQVSCDAGCNPTTGRCFPPDGDVCATAESITDMGSSQTRQIDFRQFNNNYSVSPDGCLDGNPRTGGPDRTFEVTVPSNKTMTATVNYEDGAQGAMYFVDDCTDVDGTCTKGAQGDDDSPSEEEIFFKNDTQSEITKTLIVDTAADQRLSTADVGFVFEDIVCASGEGQCMSNGNQEVCNEKGTAYSETVECKFPCQNGTCPGDTCMAPFNVTQPARSSSNGVTYGEFLWSDFSADYQGSGCGIASSHTEGYDTVMQVDLQAGEVVSATVYSDDSSPNNDPSIYIQDTCAALSDSTCLAGQETNDETASAFYQASSAQTVFIFADADDLDNSEEISVEVNVGQPICTPGGSSCSSGDVAECSPSGLSQGNTYSCSTGCTNGFCNNRDSEYCWDAENITSQLKASGGFSRMIDFSNFSNDIEADLCGGVDDFDNDGEDAVYLVDLQPNEQLTATLDPMGSSEDATAYIIGSCSDPAGTCKDGDDPFFGSANVSYTAGNSAEQVFLVADHDDGFTTPSTQFQLTGSIQ